MEPRHRIVIVGGGITGLAAAFRLQRLAAGSSTRIVLFEASERLGGKIWTEEAHGCILELGPDIFLARKPRGVGLCRELGLEDRLRPTNPAVRGSYLNRGAHLYPLPNGLSGMIPTRLAPLLRSPLLSWRGKARILGDLVRPPRKGDDDESIGAFIRRRLGREAFEALVDPLLGGIYGGGGDTLSLAATFPQLRDLERAHGSLIRGLLARKRTALPATGAAFVTLAGGMEELVRTLARRLDGVAIHRGTPVTALRPAGDGFTVETPAGSERADAVVVAAPAPVAARLTAPFAPLLNEALQGIAYGSTATLSLAYRAADVPRSLDAYGYIVPATEGRPVLACTWTSTKIPGRAPDGTALFRLYVGRAGQEAVLDADDDTLVRLAREELRATLGVTAAPLFARLHRWRGAMPQYRLGHPERLERIRRHLAGWPGLALAGAAYRGVGIPDCIHDGEQAAEQVWHALTTPSRTVNPTAS